MKKKSKLIIAITLLASILILITFISSNKEKEQKNVANKPFINETNKKIDEIEKNSSEKKSNEAKVSNDLEDGSDDSDKKENEDVIVNNLEETESKDDIVSSSDENKSNDKNIEKINSEDLEANNSGTASNSGTTSNEEPAVKEPLPTTTPEEKPTEKYVTMSITVNTILNNMDKVSEGKKAIIPSNGVILGEVKVKIEDGDTVFDILKRETRKNRIHMDFVESPLYGSAYIKGIANIYEFDAGDLSGWMYSVNGVFPGYGASNSKVENGDVIKWQYTCDLGRDLGNEF